MLIELELELELIELEEWLANDVTARQLNKTVCFSENIVDH